MYSSKIKRQNIKTNDQFLTLITRLDNEKNESVYHQNKLLSFIEIKGDRLHEFDFEGDAYQIHVNDESNVTSVSVNNQSQDYEATEIKLSPWLVISALIFFGGLFIFPDRILDSEHAVIISIAFLLVTGGMFYTLWRHYRFAYPRKE